LRDILQPDAREPGRPVIVGAVDGMAGAGKSALAVQLAHQMASEGAFSDGQLYVNLRGATTGLAPLEPLQALGRMLRSLGVDPAAIPTDTDEAAARFRSLAAERRMLLLLDDARDAEQVRPLLPGSSTCVVLITSRQVLASLDGIRWLHLDVLSPEHGLDLLSRIVGRERTSAEPDGAADVVKWCGGQPLAIQIAGARLVARPSWLIADLAAGLADATHRLEALNVGEVTVRASFDVSLRALQDSSDAVDRAAADAFGLLGLPDGPDLAVETVSSLLDRSVPAVETLLERLVDVRLMESHRPGRYEFHDLVRVYSRAHALRHHASPVRAAALTREIEFAVAAAWAAAAMLPSGPWRFPMADARWSARGKEFDGVAHALRWLEAERANLLAAVDQAAVDALSDNPTLPIELACQLASALFPFFEMRSYWHDLATASRIALKVARHHVDTTAQGTALNDIGVACQHLGRIDEGNAYLKESIAISRSLGDRRRQANSLFSLSVGSVWQGRYEEAKAAQEESVAIFREIGQESAVANGLSSLASLHGRRGEYAKATGYLHDSLAIASRLGDRLLEAAALTNLGFVVRQTGQLDEAVACLRKSLAIFRAFDHRGQANSLHELGLVYVQLGRNEQALACLRESLLLTAESGNRRVQAVVLRDLGDVLSALGRSRESRDTWREGLVIALDLGIPEAAQIRERLTARHRDGGRVGSTLRSRDDG
jgi:tetratricopeptide (TPR) repeat protein